MSKQSSSDNIRVVVRFRPPNRRELEEKVKARLFIDIIEGKQLILRSEDVCFGEKKFNFDHVFNHDTTQEQFYKIACQSVIDDVLNGFNGTIFAYGQTGAGKSYSMMGILEDPEKFGLIPRAAHAIFDTIEKGSSNVEFKICCSYVEIYNEKLQCLLDPTKKNLQIHENPDKGVYIKDLTQEYVSQVDDIYELLEVGQNNRVISFTQMNAVSSRSHSVFIISIEQTDKETGSMKSAQFNLVDLAGSEKVAKTGATGQTLKEAQNINKSLSTLGKCIYALCEGSSHVPFRDSKLTRILQNGLGGNSKTTMICACSPHPFNLEETYSTLRFGERAKTIKCAVKVNQQKSAKELERMVAKLTAQLKELKLQNTKLKKQIKLLSSGQQVSPEELASVEEEADEKQKSKDKAEEDTKQADSKVEDYDPQQIAEMQMQMESMKYKYMNEIEGLKEQLKESQQQIEELLEHATELEARVKEDEQQMDEFAEEYARMESNYNDMKSKYEYEKQLNDMGFADLENTINELKEKNEKLIVELEAAKKAAAETSQENETLKDKISDPEARGKLMSEIERLEDINYQKDKLIKELKEKIIVLQEEIQSLKADISATKMELQLRQDEAKEALEKEIYANKLLEEQNQVLRDAKKELESKMLSLESTISQLQGDLVNKEKLISDLQNEIKELKQKLADAETNVMKWKLETENVKLQATKKVEDVSKELQESLKGYYNESMNQMRQMHDNAIKEKDKEISQLQKILEEERARALTTQKSLEMELTQLKEKLEAQIQEHKKLEADMEATKEEFRKTKEDLIATEQAYELEKSQWENKIKEEQSATKRQEGIVKQLRDQIKDLTIAHEMLRGTLNEEEKKKDTQQKLAEELLSVKNQLKKEQKAREQATSDAESAKRELESTRKKLQQAFALQTHQQNRIDSLEKEIQQIRADKTTTTRKEQQLQQELEEKNKKISELTVALEAAQKNSTIRQRKVFKPTVVSSSTVRFTEKFQFGQWMLRKTENSHILHKKYFKE